MCLPPKTMNNANETNSSILGAKPAEHLYALSVKYYVILREGNNVYFCDVPLTWELLSMNMDVYRETAVCFNLNTCFQRRIWTNKDTHFFCNKVLF